MSFMINGYRCKNCLCVWNSSFGVVGTTMIGSGFPEACPYCKASDKFFEQLARTVTEEEFGKPMAELPVQEPYEFDIILTAVSQDAKIRAVNALKKLMRINSEKAFRFVQNTPVRIQECVDSERCIEFQKELEGIARIKIQAVRD